MSPISPILPLLLGSLAMPGQSVNEKEFTLTADVDLVLLDVSVKGAKGGYLTGLTKDNFQVYENGQLQTVTQFSNEDAPITVGLVLDHSRSMRSKSNEVANAALAFIDSSNSHDEMFVTYFNDIIRHGLPQGITFSDNREILSTALFNNRADGMTSLYDGIVDALHQLESGHHEKRSLVLISDGGDNASKHGFKDVLDAVELNRATIYTVGVFDSDDLDRNPGLLRRLANISGGVSYLPQDLSNLPNICVGIAQDIRHRYSIGYAPVRTDHSALRTIKVSVVGVPSQKIEIHARTSYLLPERLRKANDHAKSRPADYPPRRSNHFVVRRDGLPGIVAYSYLYRTAFQLYEGWRFDRETTEPANPEHADELKPVAPPVILPDPDRGTAHTATSGSRVIIGRISIPRLHLAAIVEEGVDAVTLSRAVGHIPGTGLPGETGNFGVAGHRDTFFRALKSIQPKDRIDFVTRSGHFHYIVESLRVVEPSDVSVLKPTGGQTLTIVTCFPFQYIGNAPRRFIVHAISQ